MQSQQIRFTALSLLISAAMLAHIVDAGETQIQPGDRVITTTTAPVKVGNKTLTSLAAGKKMTATGVKGSWVAVTVSQRNKNVTGWIAAKHLSAFRIPDISETEGVLKQTKAAPLELTTPGSDGWSQISFRNFALDKTGSYVQCGGQRSRVDHSGDSFVLLDPMTFTMSEPDPLTYSKRLIGIPSTSVIWIEPDKQPGTVVITTDPEDVAASSLAALGLSREMVPALRLEFHMAMQVGGQELRYLLGQGAKLWGATRGPVTLDGKTYRHLKGAEVREVAQATDPSAGTSGYNPAKVLFEEALRKKLGPFGSTRPDIHYELVGAEPVSPNQ